MTYPPAPWTIAYQDHRPFSTGTFFFGQPQQNFSAGTFLLKEARQNSEQVDAQMKKMWELSPGKSARITIERMGECFRQEMCANARLMESSPFLLEACQAAVEWLQSPTWPNRKEKLIHVLIEAIQKATKPNNQENN